MLCDECGKNESAVRIVQVGSGGRVERNLCEQCAMNYGKWLLEPLQQNKDVPVNEFLQSVFRTAQGTRPENSGGEEPSICPHCGMEYKDFQKLGRIGCPECYRVFRKQLEPLIRRIHGVNVHAGKTPRQFGRVTARQHEIVELRAKLQEAIAREEYELAAQYRDRLRELERGQGTGREGGQDGN